MPRVSRRAKRRRQRGLDDAWRLMLLKGFDLYLVLEGDEPDEETVRQKWFEYRAVLLADFVDMHPGHRPWGWWKFELPERRRRVDGVIHPFDDRRRNEEIERQSEQFPSFRETAYKLFYGMPGTLFMLDDFEARYETEPQYLQRLGLLTAEEKRWLHVEEYEA